MPVDANTEDTFEDQIQGSETAAGTSIGSMNVELQGTDTAAGTSIGSVNVELQSVQNYYLLLRQEGAIIKLTDGQVLLRDFDKKRNCLKVNCFFAIKKNVNMRFFYNMERYRKIFWGKKSKELN